jgi:hypothetical protein
MILTSKCKEIILIIRNKGERTFDFHVLHRLFFAMSIQIIFTLDFLMGTFRQ